jgi:hypothetical protein
MAATPGEQILLAELQQLARGQAPGSFGPAQALAMLAGFLKLRDRVDTLVQSVATFAGIDAAARLAALEELTAELQNVVAHDTDTDTALEQWKVGIEGRLRDLEHPPPPAPTPTV